MRKKRKLFDELMGGFGALADEHAGKRALRTHAVRSPPPAPNISGDERTKVRMDTKLWAGR